MRVVVIFLILMVLTPLAYSMSLKDLVARYIFSASTTQMNVTGYADYMIDKDGNGINDTLVLELSTNNAAGNFIFVANLLDKNGILTNETNRTLNSGINKLNITFNSILLAQNQFNYSIKIYNSSYSLKYRKDNMPTQNYQNYEEGFKVPGIKDSKEGSSLAINVTINSSINGTFETSLFLSYNSSTIYLKENKSIVNSTQHLAFNFGNETIKRTHFAGRFNISSVKIDKKTIKTNYTTDSYDFRDFAATSYISGFTDSGIDANSDNKYNFLQINIKNQIFKNDDYSIMLALYDLFDNLIETKNISFFASSGQNTISFAINGSGIYDKKLNGPFIVKYISLFENNSLIDRIDDAYITGNYNFNDFDSPSLPDLIANISASDAYHYGIGNITINFTFRNMGKKPAFNVFTEIFDNGTLFKANKSNILSPNSQIAYQINFTNISDFEISSIADLQDFVEESNESNNAQKISINLNKKPNLASISNITVNETGRILINLSAYDANQDNISFSVNLSKFSNKSNIFEWPTTTMDSGNYTLQAVASDGFLNDSALFRIVVIDAPEKDGDNDGINDTVDNLIGDEKSVNTSTINLTIFLGDSSNLSRVVNESAKVRFLDGNSTIAEFDFEFPLYKLNLTNVTINKQGQNSSGSLVIKGLKMPGGITKTVYVDKLNTLFNGICIKDEEISAISEISSNCNSLSEHKVECDGTLQDSYKCTYNSTLNKYRIEGLRHSGVVQLDYAKPLPQSGDSSSPASSSTSGGGGSAICNSDWQCSEWTKCADGFKNRKCADKNECAYPAKKPLELQQCANNENSSNNFDFAKEKISENIQKIKDGVSTKLGATGMAVSQPNSKALSGIVDILAVTLVLAGTYLAIRRIFSNKV